MGDYTDFLFARPSFIEGMARVLDLGSTLQQYNNSLDGKQADSIAANADMRAIAEDMWRAIGLTADEYGVDIDEATTENTTSG